MSGQLRDLLADAARLGFRVERHGGGGHLMLVHPNGSRYAVPSTPSDWRSYRNTILALERLSGQRLPRQRSGKYRAQRVAVTDLRRTSTEELAGSEVDQLVAEAERLRAEFDALAAAPQRNQLGLARRCVRRYEDVRHRLEMFHRIIPPLTRAA